MGVTSGNRDVAIALFAIGLVVMIASTLECVSGLWFVWVAGCKNPNGQPANYYEFTTVLIFHGSNVRDNFGKWI